MGRMLTFVDYDRDAFVGAAAEAIADGTGAVQISPWNDLAQAIAAGIAQKHPVAFVRPQGYSGNAPDGLPIGMPSQSRRTFFVSRARIAIGIVPTASMQVAVVWCSLTMMLMPS